MNQTAKLILFMLMPYSNHACSFNFPSPKGPHAIGTKAYHLIDKNRQETHVRNINHPYRELMIQIWYPSQEHKSQSPVTSYDPDAVTLTHEQHGFSGYGARFIRTYAKHNAALSNAHAYYPVIIVSHGISGLRTNHTAQAEELASHGYIVVSIGHTYATAITTFPDKRIVTGIINNQNLQTKESCDRELIIHIKDVCFLMDQLEIMNQQKNGMFMKRLDLKNIGIYGHSFGGAVATQVCRLDNRCKACINLDGALLGDNATVAFNKPYMAIRSGKMLASFWKHSEEEAHKHSLSKEQSAKNMYGRYIFSVPDLCKNIGSGAYNIVINDAEHNSFTDEPFIECSLFYNRFWALFNGNAPYKKVCELNDIINAYLIKFFDKYLTFGIGKDQ